MLQYVTVVDSDLTIFATNQTINNMSVENTIPPVAAFKVRGDWSILSEKLKTKFPALTDDDLQFVSGKETELLEKVGKRLNKTLEETTAILKTEMH